MLTGVPCWERLASKLGSLPFPSAIQRTAVFGIKLERKVKGNGVTVYGVDYVCDYLRQAHKRISDAKVQIKTNPDSRRLIVSAWNVAEVPKMKLPPCHAFFQFYVADGKLSCQLYQRSADIFLGVPFNIASYALFTMMIAQVCGYQAGEFIHTFGDAHIYSNHVEQLELQLSRELRPLPKMKINSEVKSIFDFKFEDFELLDYNPHPHIKGAVAV